jgi:hypothetical protein
METMKSHLLGQSLAFDAIQNAEQTFRICDALRENRASQLSESRTQRREAEALIHVELNILIYQYL